MRMLIKIGMTMHEDVFFAVIFIVCGLSLIYAFYCNRKSEFMFVYVTDTKLL